MRFKTSTLCAVSCLTVLAGFMSVNLAGCGGGGGGGVSNPTPTPQTVTANFTVVRSTGAVAAAGTVSIAGLTGNISNGAATLANIPVGTYTLQVVIKNAAGTTLETFSVNNFVITGESNQTYFVSNGLGSGLAVRGKLFVNPGNAETIQCDASSDPVFAKVGIRVRDLNRDLGRPIIATVIRQAQSSSSPTVGQYTIPVPYRPENFQVEVVRADNSSAPFSGVSPTFFFPTAQTVVSNVDVCVNSGTVAPVPSPTPTLTPTVATPVTPTAAAIQR